MTLTYDTTGPIKRIIADWTSDDTTGAVSGTTVKVSGRVIKAVTDPGATAPSANYDIAITDEESFDILTACAGTLANRHTSNTEEVYFFIKNADAAPLSMATHPTVCDKLTIAVTNAGNSKVGQIILYVEGAIG